MTREHLTGYTKDRGFTSEKNDGVVRRVREQVQEERRRERHVDTRVGYRH